MVKLFWFQCYDLGSSAVMHPFFVAQARRSDVFAKCVCSEDTGQPNPAVLEPLRASLTVQLSEGCLIKSQPMVLAGITRVLGHGLNSGSNLRLPSLGP